MIYLPIISFLIIIIPETNYCTFMVVFNIVFLHFNFILDHSTLRYFELINKEQVYIFHNYMSSLNYAAKQPTPLGQNPTPGQILFHWKKRRMMKLFKLSQFDFITIVDPIGFLFQ